MHSPSTIPGKRDTGSIAIRQENRLVLRLDTFPARTGPGDDRVDTSLGSIHFGRHWGSSRDVVSTLSMIGLGLVLFGLIFAAASSRL